MSSVRVSLATVAMTLLVLIHLVTGGAPLKYAHAQTTPRPAQPTGLTTFRRSGQTFLTWNERTDLSGERYHVYRYTSPITAANLAQATRLADIWAHAENWICRVAIPGLWQSLVTPVSTNR